MQICLLNSVDLRLFLSGIFPEGGSHDRTELLPLKPGVAIMALRAALEGAEDILVVPLGLNYYQANKILSRATIQVGTPIVIREELLRLYQQDRRAAVSQMLTEIEEVSELENVLVYGRCWCFCPGDSCLFVLFSAASCCRFDECFL